MSKKPHKVEEPATPYTAQKPTVQSAATKSAGRPVDDAGFKQIADKIFSERKELLRKLAQ